MMIAQVLPEVRGLTRHEQRVAVQHLGHAQPQVPVRVRGPHQVVRLGAVLVEVPGVDPEHQLLLVDGAIPVGVAPGAELQPGAVPVRHLLGVAVQVVHELSQAQLPVTVLVLPTTLLQQPLLERIL